MTSLRLILSVLFLSLIAACSQQSGVPEIDQVSPYFLSQDKIIGVDGVNVRYRDEGLQSGETIVMVHGFTSSLETWDGLAEELKDEYHIVRLDLPGHGLTGPDSQGRYSNEETVVFLENFLKEINADAPILIGNSLGGLAAWRLAAASPESVSKLVLIAPGGFSINGVTEEPVDVPMMVKFYLTKAPAAGVKQATAALFADPSKLLEARIETVRDMMLVPGNGDAFVARAASFTLPDPMVDLAKVAAPTLIIWGDKDVMVPVAQAQNFIEAMPNAQLKILENTGHVPQEEAASTVAANIRSFLSAQE